MLCTTFAGVVRAQDDIKLARRFGLKGWEKLVDVIGVVEVFATSMDSWSSTLVRF
jgi:hypothetical protein